MTGSDSHAKITSDGAIVGDASITVQSVQSHLARLLDAHACSICHSTLTAPVRLPCFHIFCSECIRRRLTIESACPHPHCDKEATSIHVTALPDLDVALAPVREAAAAFAAAEGRFALSPSALTSVHNNYKHLVFLSAKAPGARSLLTEKLRQLKLSTQGNVQTLADRYNEFVLKWNANVDSANPLNKAAVVNAVIREDELRSASKLKSGSSSGLHFFKKSYTHKANKLESDKQEFDTIEEGDDFDTLIRKTKARKARLKRVREAELQSDAIAKKCRNSINNSIHIPGKVPSPSSQSNWEVVVGICSLNIVGKPEKICEDTRPVSRNGEKFERDDTSSLCMLPLAVGPSLPARRHRITLPERKFPSTHSINSAFPSTGWHENSSTNMSQPRPSSHNLAASKFVIARQKDQTNRQMKWKHDGEPLHTIMTPGVEPYSHQTQRNTQVDPSSQPQTREMLNCNFSGSQASFHPESVNQSLLLAGHNASELQLSDEIRQRIERNRLIAIERKKKFYERQRGLQSENRS